MQETNEKLIAANPCPKCRSMKLIQCACPPGKGSGKDGGSGSSVSSQSHPEDLANLLEKLAGLYTIEHQLDEDIDYGVFTLLNADERLNPEAEEFLLEYIKRIEAEFALFKQKLADEGVDISQYTLDSKQPLSLVISIPSLKHYKQFIEQLEKARLLEVGGKPVHDSTANLLVDSQSSTFMTPLSTQLVLTPKILRSEKK